MPTSSFPGEALELKSLEYLAEVDNYVKNNLDALIDKFLNQFESYCRAVTQMQEAGTKGPIGFINFSFLLTNILARRHIIRLDAYDENWYADRTECSGEYETGEFYTGLDLYVDALDSAWRPMYRGGTLRDIQQAIFEESKKYHFIVAELIRVGLRTAAEKSWFREIQRAPVFIILFGGYHDKVDILYKEDTTPKDATEVKRYLEAKDQAVYTHEICRDLDLSGGDYTGAHLMFSDFSGCDFTDSWFTNTVILFSNFSQTVLENVNLENTQIFDTDFSGASLENVNFRGAKLKHLNFTGARLNNVKFADAILAEELNFDQAILKDTVLPY